MTDPEKKPADDHTDDATNRGVSAETPAEGRDDTPAGDEGSPDRD